MKVEALGSIVALMNEITALLDRLLQERCSDKGAQWLAEQCAAVQVGLADARLAMLFSAAPRRSGVRDPALPAVTEAIAAEAAKLRPGLQLRAWSGAELVRIRLLLALPSGDAQAYVTTLEGLHAHADMGEQMALYKALPLLAHPERHAGRAAEGLRSNMRTLFDAVALDNPYPAEQLKDPAFNQLVLKALFVEAPLYRVLGLPARANTDLTRMLLQYAAERQAAGRRVPVELWRVLALDDGAASCAALEHALQSDDPPTRLAAGLACRSASLPAVQALLERKPQVLQELNSAAVDWPQLVESTRNP